MGCASVPEPESVPVQEYYREVVVQTIPRNGYVELNEGYVGMAPASVWVRTSQRGYPIGTVKITGTDTATGAYVWKVLMPGQPVPARMLMDIRPFLEPEAPFMLGP